MSRHDDTAPAARCRNARINFTKVRQKRVIPRRAPKRVQSADRYLATPHDPGLWRQLGLGAVAFVMNLVPIVGSVLLTTTTVGAVLLCHRLRDGERLLEKGGGDASVAVATKTVG
jgi:hypothetical protein